MMHQKHKIQFDSFSIVSKILKNLFEFYIWHLFSVFITVVLKTQHDSFSFHY